MDWLLVQILCIFFWLNWLLLIFLFNKLLLCRCLASSYINNCTVKVYLIEDIILWRYKSRVSRVLAQRPRHCLLKPDWGMKKINENRKGMTLKHEVMLKQVFEMEWRICLNVINTAFGCRNDLWANSLIVYFYLTA